MLINKFMCFVSALIKIIWILIKIKILINLRGSEEEVDFVEVLLE